LTVQIRDKVDAAASRVGRGGLAIDKRKSGPKKVLAVNGHISKKTKKGTVSIEHPFLVPLNVGGFSKANSAMQTAKINSM